MTLGKLEKAYQEHGVVLVLGAGVSVSSRLPSWPELLRRLCKEIYGRSGQSLYNNLVRDGFPLPVLASLIEEKCSKMVGRYTAGRESFTELVRHALYRDFRFFPDGVHKGNRRRFVSEVKRKNPTLRAVGAFCATRLEETHRFKANPMVKAVVTFNLDGLLQALIYARYEKRLLRTVERAAAGSRSDKISIYHMHGFLRFDKKAGDHQKEAPDCVVLTEQDYFNFFSDQTSLFNYTFLYLLREYSSVFIGLSLKDENLRRLLHYSKLERVQALKAEGVRGDLREKVLRHFALLKKPASRGVAEATEQTLLPLGVRTLWMKEYDEIPEILQRVYESNGESWPEVY